MPPVPRPPKQNDKRRRLLIAVAAALVVAAALIGASLAFRGGSSPTPTTVVGDTSVVDGIPQSGRTLGSPKARVTLTEYIDTSCPVCKDYVLSTFPTITKDYVRTGKVKVEMQPLAFVGPSSNSGRNLVLAATLQDKGWQLLEVLYHNQGDEKSDWLTDAYARKLAASVPGLDVDRLFQDATGTTVSDEAAKADADAQAIQLKGTPTFVLTTPDGKRHLLGAGSAPASSFAKAFDKALQG
jgi:protein-disulfide isomerase